MYLEICRKREFLFCTDNKPTAKKEYECCECGRTIKRGEKYFYFVGAWREDGSGKFFHAYKICLMCQKDWDEIIDVFYDNGNYDVLCIVYGLLDQAIQEAFDEGFLKEDSWFTRYVDDHRKIKEARRVAAQMKTYSTSLI